MSRFKPHMILSFYVLGAISIGLPIYDTTNIQFITQFYPNVEIVSTESLHNNSRCITIFSTSTVLFDSYFECTFNRIISFDKIGWICIILLLMPIMRFRAWKCNKIEGKNVSKVSFVMYVFLYSILRWDVSTLNQSTNLNISKSGMISNNVNFVLIEQGLMLDILIAVPFAILLLEYSIPEESEDKVTTEVQQRIRK